MRRKVHTAAKAPGKVGGHSYSLSDLSARQRGGMAAVERRLSGFVRQTVQTDGSNVFPGTVGSTLSDFTKKSKVFPSS